MRNTPPEEYDEETDDYEGELYGTDYQPELKIPNVHANRYATTGIIAWVAGILISQASVYQVVSGTWSDLAKTIGAVLVLGGILTLLLGGGLLGWVANKVVLRRRIQRWVDEKYGITLTRKELRALTTPSVRGQYGELFESKETPIDAIGDYSKYSLTFNTMDEIWELCDTHYQEVEKIHNGYILTEELSVLKHFHEKMDEQKGLWTFTPKALEMISITTTDDTTAGKTPYWLSREAAEDDLYDLVEDEEELDEYIQFITKTEFTKNHIPQLWLENKSMAIRDDDIQFTVSNHKWVQMLMRMSFTEFLKQYEKTQGDDGRLFITPDEKTWARRLVPTIVSVVTSIVVLGSVTTFNLTPVWLTALLWVVCGVGILGTSVMTLKTPTMLDDQAFIVTLKRSLNKWVKNRYGINLTRNQVKTLLSLDDHTERNHYMSKPVQVVTYDDKELQVNLVQADYKFILVDENLNELPSKSAIDNRILNDDIRDGLLENGGVYVLSHKTGNGPSNTGGTSMVEPNNILLGTVVSNNYTFQAPLFWTSKEQAETFVTTLDWSDDSEYEIKFATIADTVTGILPSIVGEYNYVGLNWTMVTAKPVQPTKAFIGMMIQIERLVETQDA